MTLDPVCRHLVFLKKAIFSLVIHFVSVKITIFYLVLMINEQQLSHWSTEGWECDLLNNLSRR